jgi:hypothetical protein
LALALSAALGAQTAACSQTLNGAFGGARLGYSLANVGDVDGGGVDDLLFGAPEVFSPGSGAAYLYRGEDGALFATFPGQTNHHRGGHVSPAGDLNGDGVPDILIGSAMPDASGRVEAISYSRATGTWTILWVRGGMPGDYAFYAEPIDDATADGRPDVLIGAYDAMGGMGRAELLDGASGVLVRTWLGSQTGATFGGILAGCQDVDGDGTPDVLIGAPTFNGPNGPAAGRVQLYSGGQNGVVLRTWDGQAGDNLGGTVRRGPDVDGDGLEDVLLGSWMSFPVGPGKAAIHSIATGALLHGWIGANAGDRASFISRVGDVNGDSFEDIAVGADNFDTAFHANAGKVDVYSGRDLGRRLFTLEGTQSNEMLGAANAGRGATFAGDRNADGYADVAVPSPFHGGQAGRVQIVCGEPFTPGVTAFGTSSRNCPGAPLALSVTSPPVGSSTTFAITCSNVPLGSVALPLVGFQSATLQLGWLTVLIDVSGGPSTYDLLPPVIPNAPGQATLPVVPPPGYVGPSIYLQFIMVDVSGLCSPFGGVSAASNALRL